MKKNKKALSKPRINNNFLLKIKKIYNNAIDAFCCNDIKNHQIKLNPKIHKKIKKENHKTNIKIFQYSGIFAVAVLATFFPIFIFAGSIAALYLTRHMYIQIWKDIKSRRFSPMFIDAVLLPGMLITGHVLLVGIAGILNGLRWKLITQAESISYQKLIGISSNLPSKIWVKKNNIEIQINIDEIQIGDCVIIRAGEVIPIDGEIINGLAIVDQHLLTGEAVPVEKQVGDQIFASTLLVSGRIAVVMKTAGKDTLVANIGKILDNTHYYKDKMISRGYKIASDFAPISLGIAAVTRILLGSGAAVSTLWAPMGFNMIYLGPISVLIHLQIFSQQGILVKDGRVLESLLKIDTVVFDKTGTLTLEVPTVGKIHCFNNINEDTLIYYAATAEYHQSHPIAKAILNEADKMGIKLSIPDDTNYDIGYGIKVLLSHDEICVGSYRFMKNSGVTITDSIKKIISESEIEGFSLVYVSVNKILSGILEIHPSIRPEASYVISFLRKRNITTYIISGDHEKPTSNIAKKLGVDHYFSETLPGEKSKIIDELKKNGKFVCFVGDGINDAIALKNAQVSISLCGASTAATDIAQIVLMDGTLQKFNLLFSIADRFEKNMKNNLLSSTIPGIFCIGGIYFLSFGVATVVAVKYLSLTAGLLNTTYPLITEKNLSSDHIDE